MNARKALTVCGVLSLLGSIPLLVGLGCLPGWPDSQADKISQGRENAARLLAPNSIVYVDLLQRDTDPAANQDRCWPLGSSSGPFNPWSSRFGGPVLLPIVGPTPASEYDLLFAAGETEYILSIRAAEVPEFPLTFSSIELTFRAVNPFANGHVPGDHYFVDQADFPSNDDNVATVAGFPDNRTLIDLNGGDVAVVVRGLEFNDAAAIGSTSAYMNGLGPMAWVCFIRDNALDSGRFFAIDGALTGAPAALHSTPGTGDEGPFQSVQLNGDMFDALCEPGANMVEDPGEPQFCPGDPAGTYAFMDWSNLDENGNDATANPAAAGRAGFIFIIRSEAFDGPAPVVPDPSENPMNPPAPDNTLPAPGSGYNEPLVDAINGGAAETNHAGETVPGVHELSVSAFFIHTQAGG